MRALSQRGISCLARNVTRRCLLGATEKARKRSRGGNGCGAEK